MITKVAKKWGHELIWAHTENYVGKILFIEKGKRLSRQFHEVKDETIYVLDGILTLEIGPDANEISYLGPGQAFHVEPGVIHRFCAETTDVRLAEVSTPELDDVVRLEDDWGRM